MNVVARVGGFGRPSIIVSRGAARARRASAFALLRHPLAGPVASADPGRRRRGAPGRDAAGLDRGRRDGLLVLRRARHQRLGETPNGWVSGGWNWSDLLVHVSIGSSIAAGNFPPEVPYFAGVPLTYHWFADFHGAIASTVAGVDLIGVYFAHQRAVRGRPRRSSSGRWRCG